MIEYADIIKQYKSLFKSHMYDKLTKNKFALKKFTS